MMCDQTEHWWMGSSAIGEGGRSGEDMSAERGVEIKTVSAESSRSERS